MNLISIGGFICIVAAVVMHFTGWEFCSTRTLATIFFLSLITGWVDTLYQKDKKDKKEAAEREEKIKNLGQ